ncbi:MAG: hypothetical protein AAGG38_14555 [Planctomycetota bacterium]
MPQPPTPSPGAASAPAGEAEPVLKAEQYAQLAAAQRAFGPVRRAQRVAMSSAVTLGVFALLSLPFALAGPRAAFVTAGLAACAVVEFRGRAALGRLDPAGPRQLFYNQLALTAVMVVYCVWSAYAAWFGPGVYAQATAEHPEIAELLGPYSEGFRRLTVAFYGVVLLVGVVFQALILRYYYTRQRPLRQYLEQTPAWVLAFNRL